jgi:Fe-S oxidoreductase/nitrate reductase gamma subunit
MNAAGELTRQIYWSPTGELAGALQYSTYFWMALALGVAVYGFYRRMQLWRAGQGAVCFDQPLKRLKFTATHVIGQAKVLRKRRMRDGSHSHYAAWMHGLIFYGFLALVFGTTIVALEEHGVLRLYRGWFYAFVTLVCEAGGLALMVGLFMGIWRRSSPETGFRHGLDYWVLYALLFVLCVQGFAVEAVRLAVQVNPVDGALSFVGYSLSLLMRPLEPESTADIYAGLWYFHMLTTMGFLAVLPYSRAMHIVTAILNLYTRRHAAPVVLPPIDLTNEEAEYFGPKTIRDFSWKDLLSFDSCTECRRCTDICPAQAVGKDLDPRQIILKLRDSMLAEVQIPRDSKSESEGAGLYESGTITNSEIWACTNCGGCVQECPVGIDQMGTIMQLRRYQTLSLGEVPPSAAKAIENIVQHGNPWGVSADDRFKWADGLNIPVLIGDSPEVDWLYWVGCAGSYDPSNQSVARAVVQVLQGAGVEFAVLGKGESCTGEPVKRLGDEYNFAEIARTNVENLKQLKFRKIVTHCPHCFNTLKNDYPEYGGEFEVYHHSQLLSALHQSGQLKLPGARSGVVTYHDPCFLGRHNGEYDAPRKLLEGIAGLRLAEMELSRETSSCCGMGGGNMWYESEGGSRQIVEDRMSHVAATGARTLVTGCSFCMINFKGALGRIKGTEELEVIDIAQAALAAMPSASSAQSETL